MTKKIYRSKKQRIIGGVCGGIAEYVDADPTLIRLLWTIGTIVSVGLGIIAYLAAWIIMPEKP
ncbi:MAG: PspC domain-containing protein [Nanoarchaeota archaeon]